MQRMRGSVDSAGLGDPDALDSKHPAERVEVTVVVQDARAAPIGRGGDQIVGGRDAPARMQATQVPSNQDSGASGNLVSEVTKVLVSVDRSRLSYVVKQLKRLRASDAPPRPIRSQRQRNRRPGWVIDVVVQVLADEGRPMRSTHVRAAVESLLGHSVSKDSVDSCLSKGAHGKQPRFERVSYGRYRLVDVGETAARHPRPIAGA
jgi:hypothetical protein